MIHIDLTAQIGNFLELSDPFWIASAHYSNSRSAIDAWSEIQPAALTLKTAHSPQSSETTLQVRKKLSTILPRFGRSLYCDGPKQTELLSFAAAKELVAYALQQLPKTKVGASVLASQENDYAEFAKQIEGVAFCELNLKYSFRVKAEGESYLDKGRAAFDAILQETTRFCDAFKALPVFVKIPRELSWLGGTAEFDRLLVVLCKHGRSGVVVANTLKLPIPSFLLEGVEEDLQHGVICGERLFDSTILMIEQMASQCRASKVPIIATGGMIDPEHALMAIRAGASAVQVCTAFDYYRPGYYRTLRWNFKNRIRTRGLKNFKAYAERISEEGVASIYSTPFMYYQKFWDDEMQREIQSDVRTSQSMTMFVMSGHSLLEKWSSLFEGRFRKGLQTTVILPNPEGPVFKAIQGSWGIADGPEFLARQARVIATSTKLKEMIRGACTSSAAAPASTEEAAETPVIETEPATKAEPCEVHFSLQCPFYSFYLFDDKVYVAPYPFYRVSEVSVPVYVFIAGSPEFSRIEQAAKELVQLAKQNASAETPKCDKAGLG